jgi:hypothetical protein
MPPMSATPQQWDPESALEFSKHVQNWAKGHAAAAALRDRWGANFPSPTPGATQSAQPGAPGAASFSPTVANHLSALRSQGWSYVQLPGGGHGLVGKDGRRFRFDPETGATTMMNPATLAQGTGV